MNSRFDLRGADRSRTQDHCIHRGLGAFEHCEQCPTCRAFDLNAVERTGRRAEREQWDHFAGLHIEAGQVQPQDRARRHHELAWDRNCPSGCRNVDNVGPRDQRQRRRGGRWNATR